ncbi:hypothetical protein O181_007592 [Austropuccinia psidii MF-1]|uniref:HAT C-terminal dimerisation domain-containing protein n=1 Tax=Austropuccinia psidii MF-1 TaxID=1389203 RepID=A0A9Q3GIM4_9BASI|nr:hypothetical protein [Austropuccinia psidii MF-1]
MLDTEFKVQFFANHQTTLACFRNSFYKISGILKAETTKNVKIAINNQPKNTNLAIDPVPTTAGMGILEYIYSLSSSEGRTLEKKIQHLFSKPTEPKHTEVILFWKSRVTVLPTLSNMAQKYISIPKTLSLSERFFS